MHILLHNQIDLTLQTERYCYIRMPGNLPKTCNICFKTMRGDSLKRHHMLKHEKHENVRMEDMKKVEEMTYEQKYKMIEKNMEMLYAESKQKIERGGIMADIVEKKNMDISLLPKDMQEAIEFYKKFGQDMEKKGVKGSHFSQKIFN